MLSDRQLREIAFRYSGDRHVTIEIASTLPGGALAVTRSLRGGRGRILLSRHVAELPMPAVQFLLAHEHAHLDADITSSRTRRRRAIVIAAFLISGVGIAISAVSGGQWPLMVLIALSAALAVLITDARCSRSEELACDRRAADATNRDCAEALFTVLTGRRAPTPPLRWASAHPPLHIRKEQLCLNS